MTDSVRGLVIGSETDHDGTWLTGEDPATITRPDGGRVTMRAREIRWFDGTRTWVWVPRSWTEEPPKFFIHAIAAWFLKREIERAR